jgi:hypothetical protein
MKEHETHSRRDQVAAYRASGKSAKVWAAEHGIGLRQFVSWVGNDARWSSPSGASPRLRPGKHRRGVAAPQTAPSFVAARVDGSATVRMELVMAAGRLTLHWPLERTGELAALIGALEVCKR